ncbi:hypothetical protein F9L33_08420 [Amylibacter sp. SFDW26]|uniref:hypothetical protein n=1 Tax=Amylibacter sp. SFDW26 TaxID=2652722 RepID=UPI0012629E52|nr:hypothetical protein [Amylibacter sp. SFDW26]KAB7614652.1 hypothetical protein F9L33_08420 [Amylibacter sp. SFDW26]
MKKFGAIALIFLALASQAAALSCVRPNIGRTFNNVAASKDIYVMGQGTLTATGKIPKYQQSVERQITTEFTGVFYGVSGALRERTVLVTVDTICFASWCGSFPKTDEKMIVFLKKSPSGYRLESNPCDGHFKIAPTIKEIRILQKCLKKGECSKTHVQALEPKY